MFDVNHRNDERRSSARAVEKKGPPLRGVITFADSYFLEWGSAEYGACGDGRDRRFGAR